MQGPESVEIVPGGVQHLDAARRLLLAGNLPDVGLDDVTDDLFIGLSKGEVVGCAALERYPPAALLRSVAVESSFRGSGLGTQLTSAAIARAESLGLTRIFLLTETAQDFFRRFGFRPVGRGDVDSAVQRSAEFATLCPASAQAMVVELETREVDSGKKKGPQPED